MNTVILTIIGALLGAFTLFVVIVVILLLSDLLKITHFQMWQRLKKPPFSKFFWKNVIGLLILIGFCVFMIWGTLQERSTHSALNDKIVSILIKHNVCSDPIRDCRTPERIFGVETSKEIDSSLYRASELDQETISEIIAVCFDTYNEKGRKKTVELTVYKETWNQQIKWFSGVEPMIHIIFKAEK